MKKKYLFIDRDGTLAIEPPSDYQLDSFEKLVFLPGVFQFLSKIVQELDYTLVMITNQDGLGTDSFPENTFWSVQNFIVQAFENEGIPFETILIDKTFAHENAPTRKPGTGLVEPYMADPTIDMANSFVIGDRLSDIQLAKNMGCQGIWIESPIHDETLEADLAPTVSLSCKGWEAIYTFLKLPARKATVQRKTKETNINISLNLDGTGKSNIETGLGFFDHMLEQVARHGFINLNIKVDGDLHIDEHHTIEDTALALGTAFKEALGSKLGVERYGYCLPMDDVLAQVALDFGGRPWIVWEAEFKREKVGDMPTEMFFHFFKSFSDTSLSNLNIVANGANEHHKIEGIFKAFAKAIKMAVRRDPQHLRLPSTKGVL